ncbi:MULTISPECIES: hypothetical protein [Pectobacteriaceae]|uniref:Uncharacterized protein n=2 Tax=Lonsdalea TaxID=1082702 RepID=A0ACD1J7V3_9GAMM|nr:MULTISPECIES: hypothetical protein [Pectobacteriaceae]MCG8159193.1 hypothetical protein [Brenneria goodwinii]MCG8163808.1 hypothetical protein [Brenneria goodwinii]MCG8168423.1 hypothetical protein [Brenneria goodwinii]MCG8173031.1 hypothetical protein [Brenneria goodwinii]MCG8177688.1 hypothetical protein [Brenneria goodwinii]
MEKINIKDLFTLIFYCICILCCAVVIGYLIASIIVYFKIGIFNIDWEIVLSDSLKKGCVGGTILGFGIWAKGKLKERQANKKPVK